MLTVIPASDRSGTRTVKIDLLRDEVKLEEQAAKSEVREIIIHSRDTISVDRFSGISGAYELIKGTIIFEVSPCNNSNKIIHDLEFARLNKNGRVEFNADFELHRPINHARANRRLICFIPNRSTRMGEGFFNYMTGKNWLYQNGWSFLWCGWNCDVPESDQALNIRVPVAFENGKEIHGITYSEIVSFSDDTVRTMPVVWGESLSYEPVEESLARATLYLREYRNSPAYKIKRSDWDFGELINGEPVYNPQKIYLKTGFKPGWLYELFYEAKNPKVTGLGMAAIRDIVSFLRYENTDKTGNMNPLQGLIDHTFAWGHSQSGRLLNHFVYENFNTDENKKIVFDGILASCPGAGRGMFNSRFAQFTRHGSHHEDNLYPVDMFPFASVNQRDSLSGENRSAYEKAKESGTMPKIMILNSSTDYWTRGASLLHTDAEGKSDLEIDESVRIYMAAGMTHTDNRLAFIERALLVALDSWVSDKVVPPDSEVPRISDRSLVTLDEWKIKFPPVPGIRLPDSYYMPLRLNPGERWGKEGIADYLPPRTGRPYNALIPQVDEDGNDIAGIRLPEIKLAIATNCGWELRRPEFSNTLKRNSGKDWLFCLSEKERIKKNDPRLSILERYPDKKAYVQKYYTALSELKKERFLLEEDLEVLKREIAWLPFWNNSSSVRMDIESITCSPEIIRPGQECKLVIRFADQSAKDIKAELREAPLINSYFEKNKYTGCWEGYIKIPGDAPEGNFNFDFIIVDKDLKIISGKNMIPAIRPTVQFTITHN